MKYRIVLTLYIIHVQGQVNRNFRLVLNEMGPGRTSRAGYSHNPDESAYLIMPEDKVWIEINLERCYNIQLLQ